MIVNDFTMNIKYVCFIFVGETEIKTSLIATESKQHVL